MEKKRYIETGEQSFFGEYLYERVVPEDHFLRKLKALIDWDRFTQKLIDLYKGEGVVGRPPFDPALLLRVELIAFLYHLSEREVETYVNDCLSAKYFVGLAIDENAPDHSTLTKFRKRLISRGKLKVFEEMLKEIVGIAIQRGVQFGSIQVVDSVHTVANVNTQRTGNDIRAAKVHVTRMLNEVSNTLANSRMTRGRMSNKRNTSWVTRCTPA
jgi:transposase